MFKRLLVILLLLISPAAAAAEDVPNPNPGAAPAAETVAPSPLTSAPAATGAQTQNQGAVGGAAALGPAAASGSAGGSTGDSSALQPAGLSPLQSTGSASQGLSAPANALQAPVTNEDTLKVIRGDLEGAPHAVAEASNGPAWPWLAIALAFGVLVSGAYAMLRFLEHRAER